MNECRPFFSLDVNNIQTNFTWSQVEDVALHPSLTCHTRNAWRESSWRDLHQHLHRYRERDPPSSNLPTVTTLTRYKDVLGDGGGQTFSY